MHPESRFLSYTQSDNHHETILHSHQMNFYFRLCYQHFCGWWEAR